MTQMTDDPDLVTTAELAQLLKLHEYTISKMFWISYHGRRKANASSKMYSIKKVVGIISESSGYDFEPNDLADLIKRDEAMQLLEALGRPRAPSTWMYWQRKHKGPRVVRLGSAIRYPRGDVEKWAEHLSATPCGFQRGQLPEVQRKVQTKVQPCNGPNAPIPVAPGDEGGTLHLSQTTEGAV